MQEAKKRKVGNVNKQLQIFFYGNSKYKCQLTSYFMLGGLFEFLNDVLYFNTIVQRSGNERFWRFGVQTGITLLTPRPILCRSNFLILLNSFFSLAFHILLFNWQHQLYIINCLAFLKLYFLDEHLKGCCLIAVFFFFKNPCFLS